MILIDKATPTDIINVSVYIYLFVLLSHLTIHSMFCRKLSKIWLYNIIKRKGYLHFNSRRVISVKTPHATSSCPGSTAPCSGGGSCLPLTNGATCGWSRSGRGFARASASGPNRCGTRCRGLEYIIIKIIRLASI